MKFTLRHSALAMLSLPNTNRRWPLLALIFALLNLKSLPFIWHVRSSSNTTLNTNPNPNPSCCQIRLLKALIAHLPFFHARPRTPVTLFQSVVISSRSPLLECDYNLHKSNSTYFADLDISRSHLLACLLGAGIDKVQKDGKSNGKGRFGIMLGGVTCSFKREIKPYQPFEIWTRVLSWDRKWLYLVSHFVEKGKVVPSKYTLQPWKKTRSYNPKIVQVDNQTTKIPHAAILASSIAKYVFKQDRLTIPPEAVLEASGLLPLRPTDDYPPSSVLSSAETSSKEVSITVSKRTEELTWKEIEDERVRGLQLAEHMARLDSLHHEFAAENGPVLGEY